MKSFKLSFVAIAAMSAAPAFSTPINLGVAETNLQQILDGITCQVGQLGCVAGGPSSIDVLADQVAGDQLWSLGGVGISGSQLIIEISGYAANNTFGIYDPFDPSKRVQLFSGASSSGSQSVLMITDDGSVLAFGGGSFGDSGINLSSNLFGFYLDTPSGLWFSQDSLNSDQADHMVAYEGTDQDRVKLPSSLAGYWQANEYILAWDDLPSSSWDYDYNDFVIMIESVKNVPEPGTLALLGLGLVGMGFRLRRRDRQ